jgi:hypothetical protein
MEFSYVDNDRFEGHSCFPCLLISHVSAWMSAGKIQVG